MSHEVLLDDLRTLIADGQVTVVAGTGLSITTCGNQQIEGYDVATWDGLLRHGVARCQVENVIPEKVARVLLASIATGETDLLVSAAETITARLRQKAPGVFHRWLRDTLGKLEPRHPEIAIELARWPGALATLNYDGLIEAATDRHPVTWRERAKVEDLVRSSGKDAVLHLHGYFDEPDSVVLGLASYGRVTDDAHAQAILRLFTLAQTLVFVGCGGTFRDPSFGRLIEWGREALKDSPHHHFVLCSAREKGGFVELQKAAPWLQPIEFGEKHEDLLPFLHGLAPALQARPAPKSAGATIGLSFDLDAYRQAMRKAYGRLKLEDLDATSHDINPVTVTDIFLPQTARECAEFQPRVLELPKETLQRLREAGETDARALDVAALERLRRAYHEQPPRRVLDVVSDPGLGRLVILGDPGSGKSTLLQYLLLLWAEKASPSRPNDPLPLIIELREYSRHRHKTNVSNFLQFLEQGPSVRWQFDRAQVDGWLRTQPSLVCFDGLDEVFDSTERAEVATCIHRFADEYPRARVLVTSRVIGYRREAWRDEHFRHFMIQELDEPQIGEFLTRWHRDAYTDRRDGAAKRSRLARAINDSPAVQQLAGNPPVNDDGHPEPHAGPAARPCRALRAMRAAASSSMEGGGGNRGRPGAGPGGARLQRQA